MEPSNPNLISDVWLHNGSMSKAEPKIAQLNGKEVSEIDYKPVAPCDVFGTSSSPGDPISTRKVGLTKVSITKRTTRSSTKTGTFPAAKRFKVPTSQPTSSFTASLK